MSETTPVVEKPVYRTGDSVAKIIATNDAVANTPPPTPSIPEPVVTPTPTLETPVTPTPEPAATPAPVAEPPAVEKNVSSISFENFNLPGTETPATPETPVSNWKDEIKKADLKEVLKELGIDEFAIELSEHRKNGGDPVDYLQAKFVDYNKISDEALLKADLKIQYPTLTGDQINRLYDRKYAPESELQDDVEFSKDQLQADAYKVRQAKITEQQKFKIAAPISQQPVNNQSQIEAEKVQELMTRWYNEHDATKALMESKRVTLNLGENGSFNFDVQQPEIVTKALYDPQIWQRITATKTGEPDVVKLQKIILYAADPLRFESDLVNYGKSLALPGVVEEGRNITPDPKVIPMATENKGQVNWSGAKTGKVGG